MTDAFEAPNNVAYERHVLGAAIRSDEGLQEVLRTVQSDDFYLTNHRAIFAALEEINRSVGHVSIPVLARQLERTGDLADVDDREDYLANLHGQAAPVAALETYVEDLRACSHARAMTEIGHELAARALATQGDKALVAEALGTADQRLWTLTETAALTQWEDISTLVKQVQDEGVPPATVPTGFTDLDSVLRGGFRDGQMVTVAGRPGMGKTMFAMDVVRHAAVKRDVACALLSLEMGSRELALRFMAAEGKVSHTNLITGDITEDDEFRLSKVVESIQDAPLYVASLDEVTPTTLYSLVRTLVRRVGLKCFVVDYLQLLSGPPGADLNQRQQVIAQFSRSLKQIARRLGVVIMAVSQLNRGPEQRTNKRPQLADLRESGQVEQDSDVVILIHREDYYDPESTRPGEADLIVAKHREGSTATVPVAFQGHYSRFADMARGL